MLQQALDWLNTSTSQESAAYLENHPDLLGPAGLVALGEISLRYPREPRIDAHRELLTAAIADGVGPTYASLLIADLLQAWIATPTWADSRAFFHEHQAALLSTDAQVVLGSLAAADPDQPALVVHQCLLAAAAAGQVEDAFTLAAGTTADQASQILNPLADQDRPALLANLAVLAVTSTTSPTDRANAVLHLALAHALDRHADQARELAREARGMLTPTDLTAWGRADSTNWPVLFPTAAILSPRCGPP